MPTLSRALGPKDLLQQPSGLTYAAAGVDVDAGNALVEQIKPFVKATKRLGSDGTIGGFGGAFDLKALGYKDPILISGTDGVGTKLKVAHKAGIHDTVGELIVSALLRRLLIAIERHRSRGYER